MAVTVGEAAVSQLSAAAASGQLTMEPDAAREVAQAYFRYAEQCLQWANNAKRLETVHGFGSFTSSQQLQTGFANKAVELGTVLGQLRESAQRMAQGYLQAANIVAEADQLNAAAVRAISGQVS